MPARASSRSSAPEGDFARGYDTAAKGLSSYFVWLNRGKQSLVADIKHPDDAALLHRILARADVFIQNLAPGAAARAGFGSDALRERYPRLITVDISGYGDSGDYATMKAYDLLVQAESGLAMITGHPAGPGRVGVSACDIACGMAAHAGVLEALIARGITGRGTGLKVSLFDGMADWMNVPLLFYEGTGRAPERLGLAHPSICPYGAFATAGRRAGVDLDPERARMGGVLRPLPGRARPAAARRLRNQRDPRRQPRRRSTPMSAPRSPRLTRDAGRGKAARRQHRLWLRQRRSPSSPHHPALRRATVGTPNGDVSIAAPPVLTSDGPRDARPGARDRRALGRDPRGVCRRLDATPPRPAARRRHTCTGAPCRPAGIRRRA